tara:strand:+ start:1583 stop:1978 length:396 start_codon:yes stop_codon:yes gene_type:complete
MEKFIMRLLITNQFKRGFSLIEVVVSLFILSVSVITIYNLIISTATSSFELEQRYLAKEVANNRIALINTVEKPKKPVVRNGEMIMGGERWYWNESIKNGPTNDYYEYEILIRLSDQEKYVYSIKGFINNE